MSKVLVAYFSASGVTAAAAKTLAQAAGADLYEIRPAVPYTPADLRWTDKNSGETRSAPVISLDDIKFSYSGGQKKDQPGDAQESGGQGQQGGYPTPQGQQGYPTTQGQQGYPPAPQGYPGVPQQAAGAPAPQQEATVPPMPSNFTGFESFSGASNPYFPD